MCIGAEGIERAMPRAYAHTPEHEAQQRLGAELRERNQAARKPTKVRGQAMECGLAMAYLITLSDVDHEDFRYGQLLALATMLAIAVMVRALFAAFT
jgi:hypothetical protein